MHILTALARSVFRIVLMQEDTQNHMRIFVSFILIFGWIVENKNFSFIQKINRQKINELEKEEEKKKSIEDILEFFK